MPTTFGEKDYTDCAEAERCIERAHATDDEAVTDDQLNQAFQLLRPLVEKQLPQAQYLYASNLLSLECDREEDIERRYVELINAAANSGHPLAQFRLGQMLDQGGELDHDAEQSARWFRLAAEQGYAYAQWVHGLNLLSGRGLPQDETLALTFIGRAADAKFEGALEFLAHAYENGTLGLPKDRARAEILRRRKADPDVIGF